MLAIRTVAITGVVVMTAAIVMGFVSGDFAEEGSEIIGLAWGRVTLIDLYVGVALFAAFVVWRERRVGSAVAWIASFVVLGNLATALYVAVAAMRAESVEDLLRPVDGST